MPPPPDSARRRSRLTRSDRLLIALALGLLCAAAITAIADSSKRERQREARAAQRAAPAPPAAQDLDGDGTPDDRDGSPLDASRTEAPPSTAPPKPTCAARGITRERGREGSCTDARGVPVRVVGRGSVLRLGDLEARLLGRRVTRRLGTAAERTTARGTFVVVRLRVRNRGSRPAAFYDRQFGLALGKVVYRQNVVAADLVPAGLATSVRPVAPGKAREGRVVFEINRRRARLLDRSGTLIVAQFDDSGSFDAPTRRLGVIRTYR